MFSGLESPAHWLIVLVIALVVLGPKRLPEAGRSLGDGMRQFKQAISGDDEPETTALTTTPAETETTDR